MPVERFMVGPLENNLYLLTREGTMDAIVVDPSMESEGVLTEILRRGLVVKRILLTHAHADHIIMARRFHEATQAPVWLHDGDRPLYDRGAEQAAMFGLPWYGAPPIEHAIQEGCVEFDFLRGAEPYKYAWGAADRQQWRLTIHASQDG